MLHQHGVQLAAGLVDRSGGVGGRQIRLRVVDVPGTDPGVVAVNPQPGQSGSSGLGSLLSPLLGAGGQQ